MKLFAGKTKASSFGLAFQFELITSLNPFELNNAISYTRSVRHVTATAILLHTLSVRKLFHVHLFRPHWKMSLRV